MVLYAPDYWASEPSLPMNASRYLAQFGTRYEELFDNYDGSAIQCFGVHKIAESVCLFQAIA